ncbi:hypothetical protein [Pseudomonas sp. OTU750018]|uniref:hypothetical protein n=1 Tax=Pseudomonas sp. OTU750018 TaxID=2709708 RepID=UPI0014244F26|nr:hypothetical protein [Pseudomonas sp. OTU750018]
MSSDLPVFVKENEIKARFDDETLDRILAQCRQRKLRRAVLVRLAVEAWLDAEERKAISNAA